MQYLTREEIKQDLNLQETIIRNYYPNARLDKPFKIRDERTPSASLKNYKGMLFLKDFGDSEKSVNCFDIVMEKESCDFKEALQIITDRFTYHTISQPKPEPLTSTKTKASALEIKTKAFTQQELDYFGVSAAILEKYNIHSLASYGKKSSASDYFMFLYDFGEFKKINKPQDPQNRFFWTGSRPKDFIFGWEQLVAKPEFLILTSGEKDVVNLVANGFPAVSLNSESARLTQEQFTLLNKKTNRLFVCFDLDDAGQKNAAALVKQYTGIYNLKLPEGLREHSDFRGKPCKDVADFFQHYKPWEFYRMIDAVEPTAKENERTEKDDTTTPLFTVVKNFIKKRYDIRFNEISSDFEHKLKDEATFRELNENNLYVTLKEHKINVSMSDVTAILRSDFIEKYNPFSEYFTALTKWDQDKEPDYIEKICSYFDALNPERFLNHFRKHLVRTIACALDDNVFNKQAFILVSPSQNSGKSTFCRFLCPPALKNYFAENISTDKDSRISICENILINLDELSTLAKSEIQSLKSLFSKDKEKLRRPYDRKPTIAPRRASFIGSTDRSEFLNDDAGTVRWLCLEINKIDFDYCKDIDVNDIWRQAYSLYTSGFKSELNPEEIRENERINSRFKIMTLEMETIQYYFTPATKESHDGFMYAMKFIKILLSNSNDVGRMVVDNKLGRAFKSLGFIRGEKIIERTPTHGYYVNFTTKYIHEYGNLDEIPGAYVPPAESPIQGTKNDDLPF